MRSNISIVIGREFSERVRKKSFIITTLLMPLLMIVLMCLPALIMMFGGDDTKRLLIVDDSEGQYVASNLKDAEMVTFIKAPAGTGFEAARQTDSVDGVLFIPADVLDNRKASLRMYNNSPLSLTAEAALTSRINSIITDYRIDSYKEIDIRSVMDDIESDISIQTFDNTKEKEEKTSSMLSMIIGIGLSLLLYMALLIYGQQVMTSIIEEKTNRVLEIVVSSVKPFQLMLGKIAGVGLVAVTRRIIWGVLIGIGATVILPAIMPDEAMIQIAQERAGTLDAGALDSDELMIIQTLAQITPGYIFGLFSWLLVFLLGGFLLYASIFAAIGSAVDSIQDASQFTSFAVVPIILGIMFGEVAANNPDGAISIWTSIIPLTSPMVMMSRLPYGVDTWQLILSAAVLYLSVILFIWLAGKIYRIGIFMYGKKPSVKDLYKWMQYK